LDRNGFCQKACVHPDDLRQKQPFAALFAAGSNADEADYPGSTISVGFHRNRQACRPPLMDALYENLKLVDVYDAINSYREEFDFYRAELPETPATVLDIGCGTGTFALDLAGRGYEVTAVDPAPQMIVSAMQKDTGRSVNWVIGSVSDLADAPEFNAAIMTGHAFQCLLEDSQISFLFEAVTRRLHRCGSFWFETRNPAVRPWLRWTPEHAAPPYNLGGGRTVQVVHEVLCVIDDCVTFEERYDFNDGSDTLISRSTLRFIGLAEIEALAVKNGLLLAETFGNWKRGPMSSDSPEIIVRLTKAPWTKPLRGNGADGRRSASISALYFA
jgi:SAM-dependent methyltransferase